MNFDKSTFPIQKLSIFKKDEDWKKRSLDAIISREGGDGFVSADSRKERMSTAYGLYNSEYNEDDLKYVTDPFKVEDGFPAKVQNFNIIRPKIDLLLGEETKRPFNIKVIQTNDDVVTQLQEKKKALLDQYMMSILDVQQDENGQPITPQEIEKYLRHSYKTVAESTAFHALNYLKEKLNLQNEFVKGWKDGLIAGEEIYYIGSMNGEPYLERVNPMTGDYDKDPDLEFIEDGDWFVRRMEMSPATIYDRYFDLMDESDLDKLLDYSEGRATIKTGSSVNTTSIIYKEKISSRFFNSEDTGLVTIWHGVWRSYKKVGFLKYITEAGEEEEVVVDENYKVSPEENIEWEWIPEVWEGYRIGEDIYIGIGPVEYQHNSMDNPTNKKLPYCGVRYNDTNTESKSLVNIMKPLQYMYIILWYRLELALARDKGKIINMDITQIPKSMGINANQWMHYLTSAGINFFNPYEEGWDIPGREGGKPAGFNQFGQVDLTMGDVIAGYIDLMVKIEDMIGEISGVSKQRQGAIQQRELVGNVERAVIQSSHITEPLFWTHNQAKKNALTMLLNVAKHVWAENPSKKIHYILNDTERVFLNVEDEFLFSDMDVFLSDSTKEDRDIEALKTLLQPAMQNGATLLDASEIITGENVSLIKKRLQEIEAKREQMMQAQAEVEQQNIEREAMLQEEELRIKEEDSIRKAQTSLQIALIGSENEENRNAGLEEAKLMLQKQKQEQELSLKERTLEENKRQAKVAEAQKEKEISIKRTQANKKPSKSQ